MEGKYYSSERSVQMLISLLKQHDIKKCVLSPGTTNLTLVASLQHDPYFELYSSVDERSAAYIACGMAAESGEPVVLYRMRYGGGKWRAGRVKLYRSDRIP